jgi:hypothetical protein
MNFAASSGILSFYQPGSGRPDIDPLAPSAGGAVDKKGRAASLKEGLIYSYLPAAEGRAAIFNNCKLLKI